MPNADSPDQASNVHEFHHTLRSMIREAVSESMPMSLLTEEEHAWVKLAIQKEAQSIRLRQAVIEKTLAGLLWAAIAGLGTMFVTYLQAHGWKP